ncbi:MAG: outer membrane protein transport protein, partial [Candidatus Methylomirabilis sp.]|nr:outer membrane protein transport protein [Deltaproteobacteria bacterium]
VQYDGSPERLLNAFPGRKKDLEDNIGPVGGFVLLGEKLLQRELDFPFAVGVGLYFPGESLFPERIIRNEELVDVIFQERNLSIGVNVYSAIRLFPYLSLGAGITFNLSLHAATNVNISTEGQQFVISDGDTQLSPSLLLGAQFRPTDRFSMGFSFIQRQRWSYTGEARTRALVFDPVSPLIPPVLVFPGLEGIRTELRGISAYTPSQIMLGAAYQLTERLQLDAAIQYYFWEDYKTLVATSLPRKFNNTFVPRVGAEYRLTRDFTLRGGYYYEPTPVTEQPQGFNLLGTNRHVFSGGFGWELPEPFGYLKKKLNFEVAGFYHYLVPRDFDKGTGPPPLELLSPGDLVGLALLVPNFLSAIDVDEPHTQRGEVFGVTSTLTFRW